MGVARVCQDESQNSRSAALMAPPKLAKLFPLEKCANAVVTICGIGRVLIGFIH